jgi:hypothetical protein
MDNETKTQSVRLYLAVAHQTQVAIEHEAAPSLIDNWIERKPEHLCGEKNKRRMLLGVRPEFLTYWHKLSYRKFGSLSHESVFSGLRASFLVSNCPL